MSVVGFDIGCALSKVAVAHRKKIQVVPNELTKLLTPTLTAFTAKERSFGDGAKTQWTRNYKNTISQLKRWLGRQANDPKLQKEAAFWLPGITTGPLSDGRFGIQSETSQGQLLLAPEQILCGLLGQLKKFTTHFLDGLKVTDCVIACPSYFDDAQRRALLTAAKLAELKVLRLLEETTAIALNYGILRPLPENETQRVVFVDLGYAATQIAIVDFVKGKLCVRYKASNPDVGGRDFDRAIYEIFREKWQTKYNVDIDNLPKQKVKLLRACLSIKKLLTGNKDALWTLDCFHNDNDLKCEIKREEMEASAAKLGLYSAVISPLIEALEATKGDGVKIHSCEIVGGPVRVTSIQTKILETMQRYEPEMKSLSTTLNGDESCARGCALMCAMLSPNFRVKEFQVQDILTWPITISYPTEKQTEEEKMKEILIMQRGNPQPCTAKVTFHKTQNFIFKLQHPQEYKTKDTTVSITYPHKTNLNIGEFNVQLLPLSDKAVQAPKIKLFFDSNKHGILDWPKATLIEYVKREEKPKKKEEKEKGKEKGNKDKKKKEEQQQETDKNKDGDDNDTEMKNNEQEEPKKEDENKPETQKKEEVPSQSTDNNNNNNNNNNDNDDDNDNDDNDNDNKMDIDNDEDDDKTDDKGDDNKNNGDKNKKKKKKITRDLLITGNFFNELKAEQFNKMFELEANLINVDRIVVETDEAKNDLETYIYDLRDRIEESHRDYIKESVRSSTSTKLTELEDWIYDEGDNANKTEFLERLKDLKDIGDPMVYRAWEFEHREQRVINLKKLIFKYQQWPETSDEKYIHIGTDKRKEVSKYADDIDAWCTNQLIKQDRLKKYETPCLKCKDIDNKYRELYEKCNPIINTPKPKPKPKEEEKKKKDNKDETVANGGDKKEENKDNKDKDDNNDDNDAEMEDKTKEQTKCDDATKTEETTTNNKNGDDGNKEKNDAVDGMEVE